MGKRAVILAPDGAGMEPVFGVPAIRRLALILAGCGVESVHVVGAVDEVRSALADRIPAAAFHAVKGAAHLEATIEVLARQGDEAVILVRGDLVADRRAVSEWVSGWDGRCSTALAAPGGAPQDFIYGSTNPRDLVSVSRLLWEGRGQARQGMGRRVDGRCGLPQGIGAGDGLARLAENKLVATLAAQTAADDGFLARHLDRRVSRAMSRRLARVGVTPNQVTIVGASIGMLGAFFLSRPNYLLQVLGAFLFLFCVIVDGVDGEIARLKLKESEFGHYLDVITDNIVHVAIFAGIALGLYRESLNVVYIQTLFVMMGGFLLCLLAVFQCILRKNEDQLRNSPKIVRMMALVTNRDFAYLVAVLALIHRLDWFLVGSAAGTYVFAAALWGIDAYEKKRLRSEMCGRLSKS